MQRTFEVTCYDRQGHSTGCPWRFEGWDSVTIPGLYRGPNGVVIIRVLHTLGEIYSGIQREGLRKLLEDTVGDHRIWEAGKVQAAQVLQSVMGWHYGDCYEVIEREIVPNIVIPF